MEKTIDIKELIELTEKNLIQKKNKIEKQINSKSSKAKIIHLVSFTGCLISLLAIVLFFSFIIFKTITGLIESVTYSFYNVFMVDDLIIFLTAIPIPLMVAVSTILEIIFGITICGKLIKLFNVLYQMEQKIIDYICEKKHQKLCNTNDMLNHQLSELTWFKENYQYLSRNISFNQGISEVELKKIKKMMKKESIINVLYFLCIGHLNDLKYKYKDLQKEKLKKVIKTFAEQVQKETNVLQQEIDKKISNNERVKRIERYHVIEHAYDNVHRKVRCLSR